jgi:hypothetical protein
VRGDDDVKARRKELVGRLNEVCRAIDALSAKVKR